jgi:hypothetical protein
MPTRYSFYWFTKAAESKTYADELKGKLHLMV